MFVFIEVDVVDDDNDIHDDLQTVDITGCDNSLLKPHYLCCYYLGPCKLLANPMAVLFCCCHYLFFVVVAVVFVDVVVVVLWLLLWLLL